MTRLPLAAFAVLVLATVAAFFITQHLKVSTPLLAGFPRPVPAAINPVGGISCYDPAVGKTLNYREMAISFYLLNRSDSVDVWVIDAKGRIVATLARGKFMPGGSHPVRSYFQWDGREARGAVAPDGVYYVRVRLLHQGRTLTISDSSGQIPFRIITTPPHPVITQIAPRRIRAGAASPVQISYTGNENRAATVLIYRVVPHRRPLLVKSFLTGAGNKTAVWNGLIRRQPAAPGTYAIGLKVTDAACNTGSYPARLPPSSSVASGVAVTVLP